MELSKIFILATIVWTVAGSFARDYRVTPAMSLDEVNGLGLHPGDRVLFERGGVWRGALHLKGGMAANPVVYGACGEGPAPMLTASVDASHPSDWREAGNGLWRLAVDVAEDIGAMWFDGEAAVGFKKDVLADVRDDLDFHTDKATRTTLLKSAANPATRFKSIELARGVHGVSVRGESREGIVFENLHVRGCGFHGFSASGVKGVVIRNCTFDRIGGGELYVTKDGVHVRFGNAIEFWGNAEDVRIESNRFDQVYDAALTHQCSAKGQVQRNLVWRGNRVRRSEYSFEYWQQGEGAVTEDILVEGNVFEDAGYGFGHGQRWNPNAGHLILQDNTAATRDFVFRRNVFGRSADRGIRIFNDWHGALRFEENVWELGPAKEFCRSHGRSNVRNELKHLYPDYADQRHVDDIAEIEADSKSPAVYPNTTDGRARFRADFAAASDVFRDDAEDVRRRAFEALADVAVKLPPEIRTADLAKYSTNVLDYAMNNGLGLTKGGRLWASWISGGDGAKSFTVAAWSDDGGDTWTDAKLVIDGHQGRVTDRTNIIGTFWLDPDGRFHLFTDQSICHFDGRAGVWESVCENPDAAEPRWSAPRRICHGHLINKPIVLKDGSWAMSAYLNAIGGSGGEVKGSFPELDAERGATCYVSRDHGKTWEKRGTAVFSDEWQESQLVEMDGFLRVFARVYERGVGCIKAAESTDGGFTWSKAHFLPSMDQIASRFQVMRLRSGRLLFVKHGDPADRALKERCRLTAYLSEDDGATWKGGLLLDPEYCSYPDSCQGPDGTIYVSHDHGGRDREAVIMVHRFTEEDVLAKRIVSPKGRLGIVAIRAMKAKCNRNKERE